MLPPGGQNYTLHYNLYIILISIGINELTMNYTRFRGGVGTQECVFLDPKDSSKWNAKNCDVQNTHFICESYKSKCIMIITLQERSIKVESLSYLLISIEVLVNSRLPYHLHQSSISFTPDSISLTSDSHTIYKRLPYHLQKTPISFTRDSHIIYIRPTKYIHQVPL